MRVIAGHAHGRRLKAPRGLLTRPTSARARESIFSRLQVRFDFQGARVLDIFAGSGSLGCEALSRGAATVTFVDSSRPAVQSIEANLDALGMRDQARIISTDVFRALDGLGADHTEFDLIFVDAPYKNDLSNSVVERIARHALLASDGWIVVEQSKRAPAAPEAPEGLTRPTVVIVGDHRIAFYRRPQVAAPSES
ncbi:MAG: 16S rRNA (guanine(966)-N(2))-methyltransferase RsmD [Candidatus Binataceae bacterium]